MRELGPLVESCKLRLGHAHPVDYRIGMRQEDGTRRREGDGAGATRTIDEALAGEALERCDLVTDRGLHVAETKCGAPEGAFLCDRAQRDEMPELDA